MNNIESVLHGVKLAHVMWKLRIIIRVRLVMTRIPSHREPTHPGEMLREEFLIPMNISQRDLADAIHVPYQRVNELVNKKRGITPSTALRLAKFFGMSADFWLNVQMRWELFRTQSTESSELASIQNYHKIQRIA